MEYEISWTHFITQSMNLYLGSLVGLALASETLISMNHESFLFIKGNKLLIVVFYKLMIENNIKLTFHSTNVDWFIRCSITDCIL